MFCTFFTVLCTKRKKYEEKIAVLASGSGTNAENIIRYFREKSSACVALVLTNRQNAFVLERSRGLEVPCFYFPKSDWENGEAILSVLREHDIDFVVLAGFLARVPDLICMLILIK